MLKELEVSEVNQKGGELGVFNQYYGLIKAEEEGFRSHNSKKAAGQNMQDLRARLHVEMMAPDEQKLFDDLTVGKVGESGYKAWEVHGLFKQKVTKEDVDNMDLSGFRDLALRYGVLGVAAKVYLARFIEENGCFAANKPDGDIFPDYWWEVAGSGLVSDIAKSGKSPALGHNPREVFFDELTKPGYAIYGVK